MSRLAKEQGFYRRLHLASTADLPALSSSAKRRRLNLGDGATFDVRCILDKRRLNGVSSILQSVPGASPFEGLISETNVMSVLFQGVEYLIHWEGYSAFSATWESEDNVSVDLVRCVGLCLVHSFIVTIKQRKDITESGDIKEENHN